MLFPKKKRIIDTDLMKYIRTLPCIICNNKPLDDEEINDPDHINTKGSRGDDRADNIWPLCHEHHNERHGMGLGHMVRKYRACRIWLWLAGRKDILSKHLPDYNLPSR